MGRPGVRAPLEYADLPGWILVRIDGRNEPDASLACVDAATGKIVWRVTPEWNELIGSGTQRRPQLVSTYRGSLLAADGQFLCLGELGHLLWMDLSPKGYKELARAWLFAARESWALPVLSRGLLYVVQKPGRSQRNAAEIGVLRPQGVTDACTLATMCIYPPTRA